jgi:hypothetical protein
MWMTAGAWMAVTAGAFHCFPEFCLNSKRWIARHPFRSFIGTAVIIFLFSWVLRLITYLIPGIPGLSGTAERLLHDIPSLVFLGALFWLARQSLPKPGHQAT